MSEAESAQRAVPRTLSILRQLSRSPDLSVLEIAQQTGIPESTVYRILAETNLAGFTRRVGVGRYSAGPASIPFAQRYRDHALDQTAIAAQLDRLVEQSGELAAFLVPYGNEALCVETVETHRTLRCSFSTGATQPMLYGATATALLSRLPQAQRQQVYRHYALDDAAIQRIEGSCRQALTDGYATSVGALDPGVWGVSAPVTDAAGALIGTVTIMAPESRTQGRTTRLIDLVRTTSAELSGGQS